MRYGSIRETVILLSLFSEGYIYDATDEKSSGQYVMEMDVVGEVNK